jgi:hypothetical protein
VTTLKEDIILHKKHLETREEFRKHCCDICGEYDTCKVEEKPFCSKTTSCLVLLLNNNKLNLKIDNAIDGVP